MFAHLITIGFVALGGAIGAVARYGVNISTTHIMGHGFPWATLIVNVVGSFLMGVAIVKFSQIQISHDLKVMMITGFLGALTTFSTFSLDAVKLYQSGDTLYAFAYVMASVILSISALFLALWFMRGSTL